MKNQFVGLHADFVGFSASLLCAVHCLALPFLLSLTPLAGAHFLHNHWFEYAIILLSFVVASYSLVHGYRKHHQNLLPLIIVTAGFLLIGAGHFLPIKWSEALLTAAGGVTIALAHLLNWKYIKRA